MRDCPGDASGKEPTCHAVDIRDVGSIPGLRSFFRVGHGNPLWYSCWIKILEWTKKPGRLQSIGSHRVKHDWSDLALDSFVLWEWVIYGYPLCIKLRIHSEGKKFCRSENAKCYKYSLCFWIIFLSFYFILQLYCFSQLSNLLDRSCGNLWETYLTTFSKSLCWLFTVLKKLFWNNYRLMCN